MWYFFLIVLLVIVAGILGAKHEAKKKKNREEKVIVKFNSIENFKASRRIEGFGGFYTFAIDDKSDKIAYVTEYQTKVFDFKDIIGVEIIEDGSTILKKTTTRTIGGAIVGGVLAGGVGSIVGGLSGSSKQKKKVSTVSVKILMRDIENPSLTIKCFDSKTMTIEHKDSIETEGKLESNIYKTGRQHAIEIKDLVSVIIDKIDRDESKSTHTENPSKLTNSNSIADEIMKLSELKEKGILTEAEFNEQKRKVLNS